MFLNLTLLVQIIHFWIAYAIVRYFLFRPIVPLILKEEQEIDTLEHDVAAVAKTILSREQMQHNEWEDFQETFVKLQPVTKEEKRTVLIDSAPVEVVSDSRRHEIEQQLIQCVVKKVKNVDE